MENLNGKNYIKNNISTNTLRNIKKKQYYFLFSGETSTVVVLIIYVITNKW